MEGTFILKLKNIFCGKWFVVFTCNLPPEGSPRTTSSHSFFSYLLAQIYSLSNVDDVYLCGDINSHIDSLYDCIKETDNLPPRNNLDNSVNKYGEALLKFLRDANCCVMNGRIWPRNDNFTSISTRERVVVNYIIFPHKCLINCTDFTDFNPNELIEGLGPDGISFLGDRCKC